ncbi:hypothetical protein M595_5756 [Lyngbya aestuarii BL J]|uniref:Uncharacterized protein n=1 Tax=Lyngbya aestuarii BL J TaxID=1348334 RepID=U7QC33_9CYAN|nr:hypothetical protein M595_5756 [Lyngbya aestuarii BL J]
MCTFQHTNSFFTQNLAFFSWFVQFNLSKLSYFYQKNTLKFRKGGG